MQKKLISVFLTILLLFSVISTFAGCKKNEQSTGENKTMNFYIDENAINEYETNTYDPTYVDGELYTIFQTGSNYTPGEELNTNTVMVFCNDASGYTESRLNSWEKADYASLGFMTALGRDTASYYVSGKYDGETHYDIIQKDISNADVNHSAGTPYVVPTIGFCDYLVDMMRLACERDYKYIFLEEPDFWEKSGYSEAFKNEWLDYFGTEWEDPASSYKAAYMSAELKAYIMTRAYEHIGTELKKDYPEVELFVCTHSSASYSYNTPIISNNYEILNSPVVDGLVAQAWSNTSNVTLTVAGVTGKMPFQFSYMEYSELINLAKLNGKKVFTLADPLADGVATEDEIRPIYEENIIAQFINPDIDAFEVMPWPSRAFVDVSGWYKALQENIIKISGELAKLSTTAKSGSTGIGCLMSYTAAVNSESSMPAFTSLCISLINRGVPVNVLTLEGLSDPAYLDGIHTLIVSYDHIKPITSTYNKTISDWVKNGGSLIYIGGYNEHQEAGLWWKDAGFASPEAHLFSELGLSVTPANLGNVVYADLKSQVETNYMYSEIVDDTIAGLGYRFTSYSVAGATTIYSLNNQPVVVEKPVGEGNVIIAGFEPSIINSGSSTSYKLLENLVIRSMQVQNKKYTAPNFMHTTRGEYELVKVYDGSYKLDGLYLDIFSTQKGFIDQTVYENPTLENKAHKLFKKIDTDAEPYIIQANGEYSDLAATSSMMTFSMVNTAYTSGKEPTNAIIMIWTDGKDFSDVTIIDEKNKEIIPSLCYTDDYGVLHIVYEYKYIEKTNVSVTVQW